MRVSTLIFALLLLPTTVQANDARSTASDRNLIDLEGDSYGVIRTEGPAGVEGGDNNSLKAVVRYANAQAAKGHSGKTIRLRPNSGRSHCRQNLIGTEQTNLLDGSMSNCDEMISGYGDDDILIGGPGRNTLNGGAGADIMTGGGGADSFVYERAGDSTVDATDLITDFNPHDRLDLAGVSRTSGVPLTFIGWNGFTGVPGQVNYHRTEYWKCDLHWHCQDVYLTVVQADLTGDGVADFSVALLGTHNLKAHNFVLGSGENDPKFADSSFN